MAKAKRKKVEPIQITEPTPEQFASGQFAREGMHYRRVPVIETLYAQGKIGYREYAALGYYRDQACRAEDDYARESTISPTRVMGGGGGASCHAKLVWTPAIAETARIERDLGSLWELARAVAVDDLSITEYCVRRFGGREKYNGHGKFEGVVPVNQSLVEQETLLELKMAAHRITC